MISNKANMLTCADLPEGGGLEAIEGEVERCMRWNRGSVDFITLFRAFSGAVIMARKIYSIRFPGYVAAASTIALHVMDYCCDFGD